MRKNLSVIVCLILCLALCSCGAEKNIWDDVVLGNMLPKPPSGTGEIYDNSLDELWIDLYGVSNKQFAEYVNACKEMGYTVDSDSNSSSYSAFNVDGYSLEIDYYESDKEMDIELVAPMDMSNITWPSGTAGQLVPNPGSAIGSFSYEYDDSFEVYVGDITKDTYAAYVIECSEAGFNVDYSKDETCYEAFNSDGWYLSVCYEGNNVISVYVSAPEEDDNVTEPAIEETEPTTEDTEPVIEETEPTVIETEPIAETTGNVIDPQFKAAMDSYESFMDEYVAFMKKYNKNPSDLSLLNDYLDYMNEYTEFAEDFAEWEDYDMNAAETAYYLEVQTRVTQKLLEIASDM